MRCSCVDDFTGIVNEEETGELTGKLILEDSTKVVGAKVAVSNKNDTSGNPETIALDTTDEQGVYRFENLKWGVYKVTVSYLTHIGDSLSLVISDINFNYNLDLGVGVLKGSGKINLGSDLVAQFSFDGNALNKMSTGHDGAVTGAILTADRFSNLNNAYEFDGSDDYINMGSGWDWADSNGVFTISVWAQSAVENFPQERMVLNMGFGGDRDYGVFVDPQGKMLGRYRFGSLYFHEQDLTNWNHYLLVFDGIYLKTYLNGEIKDSTDTDWTGNYNLNSGKYKVDTNYPLTIGRESKLNRFFWDGKIDDLRFYSRELTDLEIKSLYHEGGWAVN